MKKLVLYGAIILLPLISSGCARFPEAKGVWVGNAITKRVYDRNGQPFDALVLDVVAGTDSEGFRISSFKDAAVFPFIVHPSGWLYRDDALSGQLLLVKGLMTYKALIDPNTGAPIVKETLGRTNVLMMRTAVVAERKNITVLTRVHAPQ